MEKFACWCVKHDVDVDMALIITACLVAALAIVLKCLAEFKYDKRYLITIGFLEVFGMFIGGFLIDVDDLVRKIYKEEES